MINSTQAAESNFEDAAVEQALICVIEIPQGSRNKYEYDPDLGGIKLNRFISASAIFPTDYGYIPETLAPDGDPLDVLVCVSEPTFPGCIVISKPIGVFKMIDEKGPDDRIVCVPCADPGWNTIEQVDALPTLLQREISHFFAIYKDLDEGRCSEVKGWGGRDEALRLIAETRERFLRRSADLPHRLS